MSCSSLKLQARDSEDIQVIAAVLQDAIVPVCDMTFQAEEKSFVMVVHRFRWDNASETEKEGCYERIRCGIEIQGVESVQHHGFTPSESGRMLDLLTLVLEEGFLAFIFAGEAMLRFKLADWRLRLEDFGEPWPTAFQPRHAT
ncbi:MAG: DUF2948 family protein [Alphaproteobacteria bacterium]|nr:DUF2948 family protein [Alphaproteobacteria bacterium]